MDPSRSGPSEAINLQTCSQTIMTAILSSRYELVEWHCSYQYRLSELIALLCTACRRAATAGLARWFHTTVDSPSLSCLLSSTTEKLRDIEEKTGYSKVIFFVAGTLLLSAAITLIGGEKLVLDLIAFVYPAYMSFKSMDAGNVDDTQWLTYWVVISFLTIAESCLKIIVNIIPFYFWIKFFGTIYLWHPKTRGAETLYEQLVRPFLLPFLEGGADTTKKTE